MNNTILTVVAIMASADIIAGTMVITQKV